MPFDAPPEVTAEQAVALLDGPAVLLDVREQDEWDAGHAPQAVHLPMSEISARVGEIPRELAVVCVCRVGGRSGAVAAALNHAGWQAYNLAGGMSAWAAARLPVVVPGGGPGTVS